MPTSAQYQMTPNMQQVQQQQPQQQVYTQHQQAMTVGQQQQQQVLQYASQQVPVVAAAPAPVPQFHPPAQSVCQPAKAMRKREPRIIVDFDAIEAVNVGNVASAVAGREVAATQHRTPERTTPQPVSNLRFHCIKRQRSFVFLNFRGLLEMVMFV
jgi:lipoate-protein ligase B